jgi:hypothetical protein
MSALVLRWQELQEQGYSISAKELCVGCPELRFVAPNSQGRVVHWSIYLGSDDAPELIQRARQLLWHFRTLMDGLDEIRLFARIGAKAADILVRPGRHRRADRSKRPSLGGERKG